MEAVPRLPMISFDLKVSPDRQPTEFGKLKQYIRDFYHEDPETYNTEIHKFETLRAQAIRPACDVNGCTVLKKYYCQLHFLQSRFPMAKDGAAAINFTWKDTYANMVCTLADIRFEIVSILYNIGALHSQLGASNSRTDAEGLKLACSHFQCAAWAFQHLKDTYPQPPGVDLAPDIMQFMYQLCLAQAQECILEKSMTDNRKATINAKVAAQIVDFYNMALNALSHGGGDESFKETVGAKLFKSWKRYGKFKQTYYGCISLLYQGQQSEEQQKMGERVAYYQAAHDKLTEAIKLSKGLDYAEVIEEALTFTMDVVEGKRKAAKNENEFIYHEEVPDKDALPDVKGAALVKGTPFCLVDPEISGPDIFSRLVPMKAHEASSLYSEEKAKLLRKVGAQIDEKDQELLAFMSSLQLDYLNIHLEPDRLPQELVDRCAALSAKPDAIQNLIDAMDKLSDTYHDVEGMLQEIMHLIQVEEVEEKEYQEVMGNRPPSIVATDLTREANKYQEAHNKADESNKTLHKAMTQHIANLRILELPLSELSKQIPSVSVLNLHQEPVIKEMQHLVSKVEEMKRQRAMLATQLRESICSDDITAQLVTRQGENLDKIFSQELEKHTKYVSLIEQNIAAQENILKALCEAYAQYAGPRKAAAEIIRQRNMTLSALMSSYDAYEDLIAKSNKGQEFYRKLETNVTKLLQRVKGTCKVQQEERNAILAKNGKTVRSQTKTEKGDVSLPSTSVSSGLKLKDYLQNMNKGVYPNQPATNPAANNYYNPVTMTYNNIRAPPALSPQPASYTEQSGLNDSTQPWVPAVRPAPVGSEGTAPSSSKTDIKSETYPPNYSNYISQYSSNASYPQYPYQSSKAYQNLPTDTSMQYHPTGNEQYAAYQYSTSTPYNYSSPETYSKVNSTTPGDNYYQDGQNYQLGMSTVNSNYQTGVNQMTSTAGQVYQNNSSLSNYPQDTTTTSTYQSTVNQNPLATGQSYQSNVNTQSYQGGTNQPAANQNIVASGQNYPPNTSNQPMVNQNMAGLNYSTGTQAYQTGTSNQPIANLNTVAGQSYLPDTQAYQAGANQPTANQNTISSHSYQTGTVPPGTQYQTGTSYQSGVNPTMQNYSTESTYPGNQNYQNGSQSTFPVSNYQPIPDGTAKSTQNYQYDPSYSKTNLEGYQYPLEKYQTPVPSPSHSLNEQTKPSYTASQSGYSAYIPNHYQYNYSMPNQSNGYSAQDSVNSQDQLGRYPTQSNQNVWQQGRYGYNSTSNQPQLPDSSKQSSTVETAPIQNYYSQNQFSYGQGSSEFQYTPATGASCYTHAGQNGSSQTNSTQSVQRQMFTSQSSTQEQMPHYTQGNYYYHPYGYQYTIAGMQSLESPSTPKVFPTQDVVSQQGQITPQSPLTYMQASNSNLTMTYCQPPSTTKTPQDDNSSNVDLLAGLDFSLSQAPLVPEQQPQTPVQSPVSSPSKTVVAVTETIEDKLNALTVQPKPVVDPQTILLDRSKETDEKLSNKVYIKDTFTDTELLNLFTQEVEKFEKFVEGLTIKTLNGPTPLDIKWKELLDFQEKDSHKHSISVARCYPVKNRYPDILPYDNSRVELPSTKDDYINASYVKDITTSFPDFIITQMPLSSTFGDFWTMVLEQQVELVICLLNDTELETPAYWPNEKGTEMVVGRIKLTLQSTNICKYWVERIIYVTDTHAARVVVHLQFTQWPGSSFPASPGPFLSLVTESLNLRAQQRGLGPCIVHCLAGVGRAGLFLLALAAVCYIHSSHTLPDLVTLAGKISTFRKNALRDREHLKFAYQALLYYSQDLLMKRGILASRSSFVDKRPKTHTRHPSEDFLKSPPKEDSAQQPQGDRDDRDGASSTCGSDVSGKQSDPLSELDPLWPIKRLS